MRPRKKTSPRHCRQKSRHAALCMRRLPEEALQGLAGNLRTLASRHTYLGRMPACFAGLRTLWFAKTLAGSKINKIR
jgi:hypothetical protein